MASIPISDIIVIAAVIGLGGIFLFYKPLLKSASWRATITPLASIMGSGFLVVAPLLYTNVGNYAVFAMIGLLILAYAVGSVIRFNIRYGEPLLETKNSPGGRKREEHHLHVGHRNAGHRVNYHEILEILEKASHFALAGAYCVSVSFYLQLLASFAGKPFSFEGDLYKKITVTVILVGISLIGVFRGLKGIERVERIIVGVNLAMIGALIAGLIYHNVELISAGNWSLHASTFPSNKEHVIRMLMGMLIVVQGFETSRFIGSEHPPDQRIKTMRWAQLIASGIYIVFVGLITVVMSNSGGKNEVGITAIIGYAGTVAPILPILITITAIGSQLAAATADDAGCSGLLESIIGTRISSGYDYIIVSAISIVLTWVTDVYQIIDLASRAFAVYYAMQCIVAILVLKAESDVRTRSIRYLGYGILGLICITVAIFGIPAG